MNPLHALSLSLLLARGRYLWQKIGNGMHWGNGSYPAKEENFCIFWCNFRWMFSICLFYPFLAVNLDLFQWSCHISLHCIIIKIHCQRTFFWQKNLDFCFCYITTFCSFVSTCVWIMFGLLTFLSSKVGINGQARNTEDLHWFIYMFLPLHENADAFKGKFDCKTCARYDLHPPVITYNSKHSIKDLKVHIVQSFWIFLDLFFFKKIFYTDIDIPGTNNNGEPQHLFLLCIWYDIVWNPCTWPPLLEICFV